MRRKTGSCWQITWNFRKIAKRTEKRFRQKLFRREEICRRSFGIVFLYKAMGKNQRFYTIIVYMNRERQKKIRIRQI